VNVACCAGRAGAPSQRLDCNPPNPGAACGGRFRRPCAAATAAAAAAAFSQSARKRGGCCGKLGCSFAWRVLPHALTDTEHADDDMFTCMTQAITNAYG